MCSECTMRINSKPVDQQQIPFANSILFPHGAFLCSGEKHMEMTEAAITPFTTQLSVKSWRNLVYPNIHKICQMPSLSLPSWSTSLSCGSHCILFPSVEPLPFLRICTFPAYWHTVLTSCHTVSMLFFGLRIPSVAPMHIHSAPARGVSFLFLDFC